MDPISNMLTSIRNAQAVLKETVNLPYSEIKFGIAKILKNEGFVEDVEKKGRRPKKLIIIKLKYNDGQSVISGLKRVSKPGQRIYTSSDKIKKVKSGYGISIISTSKGLMTDEDARKKNLGGEMICQIW